MSKDIKLFTLLASSSEKDVYAICSTVLEKYYPKENIYKKPEYIYAAGSIPIMLVAHMDTVLYKPARVFYIKEKGIFVGNRGLGADDRAGILGIIKLIQKGYRPSILFTTMEEIGGLGALTFIKDYSEKPPNEIKYMVEIDRRGRNECVFYKCYNPEFFNYIESFGFKTQKGIFSDISFICPIWNIAGVNLSAGYYNEHTEYEYFVLSDLYKTIDKIELMLNDTQVKQFSFNIKNIPDNVLYTYCSKCKKIMPMSDKKIQICKECQTNDISTV